MRALPSVLADPMLHIFLVVALLLGSTVHRANEVNDLNTAIYTPKEAAIRSAFLAKQSEELRIGRAQSRVPGQDIAR